MSPEIILKKRHNKKTDIWALGVLLYELLMGNPPFEENEMKSKILTKKIMVKKSVSKVTRSLLRELLNRNEKERPCINRVLKHKAFQNKQY